jgi:mannitol/fructose-specific phosphotransferase system IIA component (Ntr-type)
MPDTPIRDLLSAGAVRVGLPAPSKEAVLDGVVDLLDGHPAVLDLEGVRENVHAREARMSTGVGSGLAIPHARSGGVTGTTAAFAVTADPVGFGAIDGEPVQLVFLLVGPERERSHHLVWLSRVSRLMNRAGFRADLLAAKTPEAVLDVFALEESAIAPA